MNKLTYYDYWRVYNGSKKLGSMFWLSRDEDTTYMRCLKKIWLLTGFTILAAVKAILIVLELSGVITLVMFCFPCMMFDMTRKAKAKVELYGRDGVEVTGHVSDRWVENVGENGNCITCRRKLTYFDDDGTKDNIYVSDLIGNVLLGETPRVNDVSVTMLVLPDRPGSGVPKYLIEEETHKCIGNGVAVISAEKKDIYRVKGALRALQW